MILRVCVWLIVAFLLAPIAVVVLFAFNAANYIGIPTSFTLHWFARLFANADFMRALAFSLELALAVLALSLVLGTAAALALARGRLPGAQAMTALFLSPLILPAILLGLAMFQLLVLLGVGRPVWGLLAGHVVVAVPYVIRTTLAVLANFDASLEEAAASLGAAGWRVFAEVTLPLILPGVLAGGLFAFIISFDQFPLSLFLVSPGHETFPIVLFNYLKYDFDPTVAAASTVSIGFSLAALALLARTTGLQSAARL